MSVLADLIQERFPELEISELPTYLLQVQDESDQLAVRVDGSKNLSLVEPMAAEVVALMRNRLIDHVGLQHAVDRSHPVITAMANAHKEVARKRPNAFRPGVTEEVLLFHRHYLQQLGVRGAAALRYDNLVLSLHRKFEVLSVQSLRPQLTWPVALSAGEYLLEAELQAVGPTIIDTTVALDGVIEAARVNGVLPETPVLTPQF